MRNSAQQTFAPAQQERCERFRLARCVDIHCHCLPGLDDGPASWRESLALCRALVDDGVTTVIASPHQLGSYGRVNSAAVIRDLVKQLTLHLEEQGIPLEIAPGADVRIDERLLDLLDADELATAADAGRHLLLELPHELFVDPLHLIHELVERGIQPIMTHPERYHYLHGSSARLRSWVAAGAVLQITAGSLTGEFGRRALHSAWRLVQEGWVSLVATDAHDAQRRAPRLTQAIELLERAAGQEVARSLCGENPLRVLQGQLLSPVSPD